MASASTATERTPFADRYDAGRQLAERLSGFREPIPVVIGMAPDGMPVAVEVANALGTSLDAVAVAPLTLGATEGDRIGSAAEGGIALFDRSASKRTEQEPGAVDTAIAAVQRQLTERSRLWHRGAGRPALRTRQVLLVTDVLREGSLPAAAACAILDRGAAGVTCAAPFVNLAAAAQLTDWVQEVVCLSTLEQDAPLSACFTNWEPVSDEETSAILHAREVGREPVRITAPPSRAVTALLRLPWSRPPRATVVVIGDGERIHAALTAALGDAGMATLELAGHPNVTQLVAATRWLRHQPDTARLPIGHLGLGQSSTIAAEAKARLRGGVGSPLLLSDRELADTTPSQLAEEAASWFAEHLLTLPAITGRTAWSGRGV